MILPSECLEQLKCSICDQILSLFPIYVAINTENQLLSVCGRCQVPDDKNYLRNEIYESVVKTILFPCINREYGCVNDLLPEDVQQHELSCSYRLKSCVFNKKAKCQWEGRFNELLDHCKTEHNHLILENNKFEIEINKNDDTLNILQYEDEFFLFQHSLDHISKRFKCSVIPLGFDKRTKKYYGRINLTTEETTISKKFPEIDFNENNSKSLDINIENISNANNTMIAGMIKITATNEELDLNHDTKLSEHISLMLKCSACSGFLYPPVYECADRHYACFFCKNRKCIHRSSTIFTVLSPLNDILNLIHYECKYGCESLISSSDLENHFKSCKNKPFSCLLKDHNDCKWADRRKDIVQHIFKEHKENIIKINEIVSLPINIKLNELKQYYGFVKYSGISFKLVFQYRNPHLLWRLETVDATQESSDYKFEITVFDKTNNKLLTFKESCADLKFINQYDIKDIPCLWLNVGQIINSVPDNSLSFKVNISK